MWPLRGRLKDLPRREHDRAKLAGRRFIDTSRKPLSFLPRKRTERHSIDNERFRHLFIQPRAGPSKVLREQLSGGQTAKRPSPARAKFADPGRRNRGLERGAFFNMILAISAEFGISCKNPNCPASKHKVSWAVWNVHMIDGVGNYMSYGFDFPCPHLGRSCG